MSDLKPDIAEQKHIGNYIIYLIIKVLIRFFKGKTPLFMSCLFTQLTYIFTRQPVWTRECKTPSTATFRKKVFTLTILTYARSWQLF